jgi:hypothetical protein
MGPKWTNAYEHITMDEWHMDMTFFSLDFCSSINLPIAQQC